MQKQLRPGAGATPDNEEQKIDMTGVRSAAEKARDALARAEASRAKEEAAAKAERQRRAQQERQRRSCCGCCW